MDRLFQRIVRERFLNDEESLRAYSYDGGLEAAPRFVLKPRSEEELRRLLVLANQYRAPIVPRGGGTGLRGGTVKEGGVIVDLRLFSTVRVDRQRGVADVGAGVPVQKLNRLLAREGLAFPLVPESPAATIGGMAAVNMVTEESFRHGDFLELVEQAECFDGVGRFLTLKGGELARVIGKEGATAIITRLRVRLTRLAPYSLDVVETSNPLADAARLAREELLALEYLCPRSSRALGLPEKEHLFALREGERGRRRGGEARSLWEARKRLVARLWEGGFTLVEEASLGEEAVSRFLRLCRELGAPCYGHLGIGVLTAQLSSGADSFRARVVALGGRPAGKHGYGRVKAAYAPEGLRREVSKIKESWDYNKVLNPGLFAREQRLVAGGRAPPVSARRALYEEENPFSLDARLSNRHVLFLAAKGVLSPWLYKCSVGVSEEFDEAVIGARERLVRSGVESVGGRRVLDRLRAGKTPF